MWFNVEWDWGGVERDYHRAIQLNPAYSLAHSWYGNYLACVRGKTAEAIREGLKAIQLDPVDADVYNTMGFIYFSAGHDQEATASFERALELTPKWTNPRIGLSRVLLHRQLFDRALAEADTALRLGPGLPLALSVQGSLYSMTGRTKEAKLILDQLQRRTDRNVSAETMIYVHLGDLERAAASLEVATKSPELMDPFSLRDPNLGPLRAHPRYVAALKRVGVNP